MIAIEINEEQLQTAITAKLMTGELGDKVARELANMQAEILTYNPTEVAGLLNISRNTVYELRNAGKLQFTNGRISLAKLLEYRRSAEAETVDQEEKVSRNPYQPRSRRRSLK